MSAEISKENALIERVAWAIHTADEGDSWPWGEMNGHERMRYYEYARAALAELRSAGLLADAQ